MCASLQLDLEASKKEAKRKLDAERAKREEAAGGLSLRRVADLNRCRLVCFCICITCWVACTATELALRLAACLRPTVAGTQHGCGSERAAAAQEAAGSSRNISEEWSAGKAR